MFSSPYQLQSLVCLAVLGVAAAGVVPLATEYQGDYYVSNSLLGQLYRTVIVTDGVQLKDNQKVITYFCVKIKVLY